MNHASSEDCPCCQRCLAPGLDTDRALVAAFVAGVAACMLNVPMGAALCGHHASIAADAAAFISTHPKPD